MRHLKRVSIVILLSLPPPAVWCQQIERPNLADDFEVPRFHPLEFLIGYFPSELIGNGLTMKSYIRSDRYRALRHEYGDLRAVDALYLTALRLTRGNRGMALFYCTVATIDHRLVGFRIPLVNASFPLTNESRTEFAHRIRNLPANIYPDSPPGSSGDRDKLQHFFGSALIAHLFESRGAAERCSDFIEWGEDAFIVGGAYDGRDLRANRHGREFGLALLRASDPASPLPSHFLKFSVAGRQPQALTPPPFHCGGGE